MKNFAEVLTALQVYYKNTLSDDEVRIYAILLSDISPADLADAALKYMATKVFFPKASELRDLVKRPPRKGAIAAWGELNRALAKMSTEWVHCDGFKSLFAQAKQEVTEDDAAEWKRRLHAHRVECTKGCRHARLRDLLEDNLTIRIAEDMGVQYLRESTSPMADRAHFINEYNKTEEINRNEALYLKPASDSIELIPAKAAKK